MKSWGHQGGDGGHTILKSDGERSIVALRTALAKFHGVKVVPGDPPRGESQSNRTIEEAGKTVREFVRVLREHVQDKAEVELGASDWMVRWAAMMVSRFLVGKDGLTAYERRRGRKCRIPVVAFGKKVWYKEIRPGKERANKLESEWREGLWLGHSRRSNEAVIGTRAGVVRAYAVKRMDEESRWAKYLQEMKGTPQQPDPSRPGLAIPIKVNIDPPHEESPAPAEGPVDECHRQVRRMRITGVMLQKYGYTEGCDGCRYKRARMREARPHTEVCRRRIGEAKMEDETDRRKEEEEDERVNWRLAEKMEKILKEKQETAETIEKDPEDVTIEQEPEEVKQEPEEDCRVGKRPMEQQEEGPERKRMQVSVKDALAQKGQRRRAGGEKRGPQETKEVQGENKRPRDNAPEEESAELPMNLSLIQQLSSSSARAWTWPSFAVHPG